MKKFHVPAGLALAFALLIPFTVPAVVITNNLAIGPFVTTYDGTDLVISNCTVTMDGPHAFNSLAVGPAGVLTHSVVTNSMVEAFLNITNEPVVLNGFNPATLQQTNVFLFQNFTVTDSTQSSNYVSGADYLLATNLVNGLTIVRASNSSIPDGSTVLVSYMYQNIAPAGLYLVVAGNVTVTGGGAINASGVGYGPGQGPGHGSTSNNGFVDGSGAGHGGNGGISSSNAVGGLGYDSIYQPVTAGSGGGSSYAGVGGSGGGQIQIIAGGTVDIEGVIAANGGDAMNSRAGGGSGGSISISSTNLVGLGSIAVNGGAGEAGHGGGGGGGMISIQCATNTFSGTVTAYGGGGYSFGGAGTILTQIPGQNSLLRMDNGGGRGTTTSNVQLPSPVDMVIGGNARVVAGSPFMVGNVTILTNGVLLGNYQTRLSLSVNNLTIQAGGALLVDTLGYFAGTGPGQGLIFNSGGINIGGGGGYGGPGSAGSVTNAAGGGSYDSQSNPTLFGSGGGDAGGSGGGAVQLIVSGTLHVDGSISANGGNGIAPGGGGGAGGDININALSMAGAGAITANGGNAPVFAGYNGGGGGGGRIFMNCPNNTFTGIMTAYGGSGGTNWGGAGTIYLQQTVPTPQLILDNGGHVGPSTSLQSASPANLTIQNGARGYASSTAIFANLLVASNSWLTALSHVPGIYTISGNATFQSGGGFLADSGGNAGGQGPASGSLSTLFPYGGGGGGYGGRGGNAITNSAAGNYGGNDTAFSPSSSYSGSGGGGQNPNSIGGYGGGFLQMTVGGTLRVDGLITANGGNGSGDGGGGGAGGGVLLTVGTFSGGGAITANGGAGANFIGGGGGGGRIALSFNSQNFTGNITAYGGNGANYGGAGTVYLKTNSVLHGMLIVDNAGHVGADTPSQSSSTADVTLRNGTTCFITTSVTYGNLVVGSNAVLIATNSVVGGSPVINAGNVIIQSGGFLSADGTGTGAYLGIGHGIGYSFAPNYPGSGGGHGGNGGNSLTNAALGGTGNDTFNNPLSSGSGGGGETPFSFGGVGGGAVRLVLTGVLQVDGMLSANGLGGSGVGGGGGSGGAINVSCTGLIGAGTIAANGGSGVGNIGGGGGGGMIALAFNTNIFSGEISCVGGGGANYGGAGTIYFRTNTTSQNLVTVDNAGHRGANTQVTATTSVINNLVLRNGAMVSGTGGPLGSLLIASNALLTAWGQQGANVTVSLIVSGNANVQVGGGISADAAGNAQNIGNGFGRNSTIAPLYACSGAGHGGYGAFGISNTISGGNTYDTTLAPQTSGSGGGGFLPYSPGGAGGGYINLQVNGTLRVDGSISANGGNGTGIGGGGGSGGTIVLTPTTFSGSGSITANGGNGANAVGGGGGGGRIAISSTSLTFTGAISAYGGGGAGFGGAGTIYTKTNIQSSGLVLIDNGNNFGTNTVFDPTSYNVVIQRGATAFLPSTGIWSIPSLTIHTNGALVSGGGIKGVTAGSITIDAGGVFSMDRAGLAAQTGTGAGASGVNAGGGGHGGYGGGNPANGGRVYDSIRVPVSIGSGGGNYTGSPSGTGGSGGGFLPNISVSGLLTVNGRLSANGGDGGYNSGGGSGGGLYFSSINTLAGTGVISANGGAGNGLGGGGGGGRIALVSVTNNFTGTLSAYGGNGMWPGGAGTIYTSIGGATAVLVNNGGILGTNTPLDTALGLPTLPFDLNISGGATVVPTSPLPILLDLNLAVGGTLTMPVAQSNLVLVVQNNANVAGNLTVDNLGWAIGTGPGAGGTIPNQGAGGGYGGAGGASANGAPGGVTNGSAAQPVDFGSGGGSGFNTVTGGSHGGGLIRLSVGGTLNVNGNVSANGDFGWQDDSGGGSGGSIWITANSLTGSGTIAAMGGNGAPAGGGGGGGGRIAIYSPTDLFTGTNVLGGGGFASSHAGTVYLSNIMPGFQIVSQSPTGTVANVVSSVDLTFNEAIAPASLSPATFTITTPAGVLPAGNLSATLSGLNTVHLSFPTQNFPGNYTVQAATTISNIFAAALAQNYSGSFIVNPPTISGVVTDTNGTPVAGVLLQPNGGLTGATTDGTGAYSIGVPVGWSGTVTPSFGTSMFIPGTLSYANLPAGMNGQNFVMVPTIAPSMAASVSGGNLSLGWTGITGVTYQAWISTNLVDWVPYGSAIPGTNGLQQINLPLDSSPSVFFRLGASD